MSRPLGEGGGLLRGRRTWIPAHNPHQRPRKFGAGSDQTFRRMNLVGCPSNHEILDVIRKPSSVIYLKLTWQEDEP